VSVFSRGAFLKALGAAALWPSLDFARLSAVNDLFSHTPEPAEAPLRVGDGSAEWFRQQVDTVFRVRSDDGSRVALQLMSVTDRSASSHIEQFSLIFHAPSGTANLDGTRACEHQALGHFDLFIVPIGKTTGTPHMYEACFSRFVGQS
jgi:hypothetical protein